MLALFLSVINGRATGCLGPDTVEVRVTRCFGTTAASGRNGTRDEKAAAPHWHVSNGEFRPAGEAVHYRAIAS